MRVGFLLFNPSGNVAGELDDLVELAVDIEDRVVGGFKPDDPAMLAKRLN